ncbi:hypothetical protein [Listeria booriae]|uniref:DUF4352 domain-containing protein n=1 Tax=Listeria booriae TaxID=1552123 RepID=A0A7X0XI85_9LIST|nr:hypothetical protein [Listeria booriae]MBC1561498.1 DUF4352 domain-containing protein [Listeria booriae]
MKKQAIKYLAILLIFTVFIAGCGQTKDQEVKANKDTVYKQGQIVNVSGLKINMENAKLLDGDGKENAVVQFNMKVTNGTADVRSFTSLSLVVKNEDGKELDIYPAENVGADIKAGDSISGPGFYKVKGKGPFKVIYTDPDTKKSATWEVKIDK